MATANIDEQPPPIVAPSAMQEAISEHNSLVVSASSLLSNDQKADFECREQKPDSTVEKRMRQ